MNLEKVVTIPLLKYFYIRLHRVFATKKELSQIYSITPYYSKIDDETKQITKKYLQKEVKPGDSIIDIEGNLYTVEEVFDLFIKVKKSLISIKGYKGNSLYLLAFAVPVPPSLHEGEKVMIEVEANLFQGDTNTLREDDYVIDKAGSFFKVKTISNDKVLVYGPLYSITGIKGEKGFKGERGHSIYVSERDLYINSDVSFTKIENSVDIEPGDFVVDAKGDVFSIVSVDQDAKTVHLANKVIINLRGPMGNNGKSFYEIYQEHGNTLPADLKEYIISILPKPEVTKATEEDIETLAKQLHG
jgi:hypothetical protein